MKNSGSQSIFLHRDRCPEIFADLERLSTHLQGVVGVPVATLWLAREALKLGIVTLLVKNGLHSAKRGRPTMDNMKVRKAAKEATEEMTLMELTPKVNNG